MSKLIVRAAVLVPHFRNPKFSASFAAAYIHEPDTRSVEAQGRLAAVVEVLGDARQSENLVDLIINTALDHYYAAEAKPTDSPDKRFELAIKAVNDALKDYASKGYSGWVGKVSGLLAAFTPDHLILAVTGSAEAILYRDDKYHHLASDKRNLYRAARTFENIISGPTKESDRILLATPALMHQVAKTELQEFISHATPPAAISKIAESIRNLRQTDRVAAVVAEYITPEQAAAQPLPKDSTAQEITPTRLAEDAKTLAKPVATEAAKLAKSGAAKARQGLGKGLESASSYLTKRLWPQIRKAVNTSKQRILKKSKSAPKRTLYLLAIGFICVVGITTLGLKALSSHHRNNLLRSSVAADESLYQKALQDQATGNSDQAKQEASKAQANLLILAKSPGSSKTKISSLQQSVATLLDKLNGLTRLSAQGLTKVDSSALVTVPVNNKLYIFATDGTIQIYDASTGQLTTSKSKLNGHVVDAAYSSGKSGIYALTSAQTVWLYSIASDSLANQAGTDGEWPKSPSIGAYGSTLYLISSDKNQVLKYPAAVGGFAASVVYLNQIGPASSLSVNGSIYLISGNTLKRYLSGVLSGSATLPASCAKPSHAVGNSDDTTVIVSCGNQALVTYNVSGNQLNLTSQIVVSNVKQIMQLGFTSSGNDTVFFTDSGQLYQLNTSP